MVPRLHTQVGYMTRFSKVVAVVSLAAAGLALAPTADAQPFRGGYGGYHGGYGGYGYHGGYHGYRGGYGYRGGNFVGGALLGLGLGAVVGSALAPPVVYAPPPPVVYAPPPVVYARPAYGYGYYGY